MTLGKPSYISSVTLRHSANLPICRVSPCDTRQLMLYAECHRLTLGKPIFFILPPKLFVLLYYNTCCSVLKFCTFLSDFTIFRQFILVKWIFGNFLDLNCKGFEYPKKVNKKMIFLSLSLMWDRIQGQTRNFEHRVRETWPQTCGGNVWKFYKKQMKSENHEIHRVVTISYVEAMAKNWECFGTVNTYAAYKSEHLQRSFWDLRSIL